MTDDKKIDTRGWGCMKVVTLLISVSLHKNGKGNIFALKPKTT